MSKRVDVESKSLLDSLIVICASDAVHLEMDLNPDPTRATADADRALLAAHGLRLSAATGTFIWHKAGNLWH